jgi:LAO/AO transport system kinase
MHGNPEHDPHVVSAWHPKAIQISALHGKGVDTFWAAVTEFRRLGQANGKLAERRQHQALAWMWERIDAGLKQAFKQNPAVRAQLPAMTDAVVQGRIAASTAARNMLQSAMEYAQAAIK